MNDSNQLNKIRMSSSNINKKNCKIIGYFQNDNPFIWSAKTLLEKSNNVFFFASMSPILLPNLWNVILQLTKSI
jgi:hypothetical protein